VRPTGKDDVTQEPEWQAVERLLKESHDKNWLDRTMLSRWRRLGWVSAVLLILVILGAGYGGYKLYRMLQGERQEFQTAAAADDARALIATSLRATDAVLEEAGKRDREPAAASERLDLATVRAATADSGPVLLSGGTEGYVWIGSDARAGQAALSNLRDVQGRVVAMSAAVPGRYLTGDGVLIRDFFPNDEEADVRMANPVGILPGGSPVSIEQIRRVERAGGVEYWARTIVIPTRIPVDVTLAGYRWPLDGGPLPGLEQNLDRLGYEAETPTRSDDAHGRANVLYCFPEDQPAATRLAATATRLLALSAATRIITVAPRQNDSCQNAVRGRLVLMLDFSQVAADR
jgi:hypothetical protein